MDFSLPPWLQAGPPESPLSAARTSAELETSATNNFLGRQRNDRENALAPLRQQEAQLKMQDAALDIDAKQHQMADYLANKSAFSQLSAASAQISATGAWADPRSEKAIWDIAAQNPSVVATPQFDRIIKQFDVAGASAIKAKEAETKLLRADDWNRVQGARIDLKTDELAAKERMHQEDIKSKKEIAEENNRTKLALKKEVLSNESKFDLGDRLANQQLAGYIKKLETDTEIDPDTLRKKISAERTRLLQEADKRKGRSPKGSVADDLPDPSTFGEGTVINNRRTGKKMRLTNGSWTDF